VKDDPAGLVLPLPDPIDKSFPPHRVTVGLLFLHKLALDDHLRRNASMVHSGLPEHIPPPHAFEAHEDVLKCVVQGMADMERASDVGWRNDNAVGLGACSNAFRLAGRECIGIFPLAIDSPLDLFRLVGFFKHGSKSMVRVSAAS